MASAFLVPIPFGVVIAKTFCKIDPREAGSHSSGGNQCFAPLRIALHTESLPLACDVLRAHIPGLGRILAFSRSVFLSALQAWPVFWAMFFCFMGFGGGKAVATSIERFHSPGFPWPLLGSCALCMLVIWRSGYVSLGSLSLLASLPIFFDICWFVAMGAAEELVPVHHCLCQTSRKYFPAQERHGKKP